MTEIEFTAEDFRQYNYCPRIIYFRYVLRSIVKTTYKMKKGQEYHDDKIRRKSQSKKENAKIIYNKFLVDKELGLAALFDAIVEEGTDYYPIEYKTGQVYNEIPYHHKTQLLVQAIILDSNYQTNVVKGEIRYSGERRLETTITMEDKIGILKQHSEMLRIIQNEFLPDPTKDEGKCQDCEYWLVCKRA